ncbi:hypothetical protein IG631_13904 [Alternaria alternata]|nr:hypothetical protein IG631_13904 [Alternaria alternata]
MMRGSAQLECILVPVAKSLEKSYELSAIHEDCLGPDEARVVVGKLAVEGCRLSACGVDQKFMVIALVTGREAGEYARNL